MVPSLLYQPMLKLWMRGKNDSGNLLAVKIIPCLLITISVIYIFCIFFWNTVTILISYITNMLELCGCIHYFLYKKNSLIFLILNCIFRIWHFNWDCFAEAILPDISNSSWISAQPPPILCHPLLLDIYTKR